MDEKFQYQPLPRSDGLRILHLEASKGFASELVGTLSSVPFSAKPAYVALSYTWQDRDASHAAIPLPASLLSSGTPFLRLRNASGGGESPREKAPTPGEKPLGARFPIGHNLALALLHLRPRGGPPLPLWIDQVCISQEDNAERGAQVALMSFIYQRTRLVVCWLGVTEWYGNPRGRFSFGDIVDFSQQARKKGTRLLLGLSAIPRDIAPGALADLRSIHDMELYQRPTDSKIDPLNPYWQRMWIVQEVCLAPRVVFLQGPYACDEIQIAGATRRLRQAVLPAGADKDWIQRLVEARAGRFSEEMRLEALVARFQESGCHELRDKLFALVGLAYDAWAIAGGSEGAGSSSPERGDGKLSIDYERSFFDIWHDAVIFVLRQALPTTDFGNLEHEMEDERRAKIVRFAGILQQAFAGRVHEEMTSIPEIEIESKGYIIAKGYIAGRILHLGPTHDEYVGSHWHHSQWFRSWSHYYSEPSDLEQLREMEEQFSNKIVSMYTDADVARVSAWEDMASCCFAFSVLALSKYTPDGVVEAMKGKISTVKHSVSPQGTCRLPRRFLGSDRCLGMAPAEAQVGDLIVRFWNCNAAVVVRTSSHCRVPRYRDYNDRVAAMHQNIHEIIGRADVPELKSRTPHDPEAKEKMKVHGGVFDNGGYVAFDGNRPRTNAVYISMDFRMLQKVSEAIVAGE
ncbi:hypothetical protein RB594_005666 [Gaeumannomyces avenae]